MAIRTYTIIAERHRLVSLLLHRGMLDAAISIMVYDWHNDPED